MKSDFKLIANGNIIFELSDRSLININAKLIRKKYYNDESKRSLEVIKDILYFKNNEDFEKYKKECYKKYEKDGFEEIPNIGSPKFTEQEIIDNFIEKGKKFINYKFPDYIDGEKSSTTVNFTFYNKSNKVEIFTRILKCFKEESMYKISKPYYFGMFV